MDATSRVCWKCRLQKPLSEFSFRNETKNIRHNTCKVCVRAISRKWYLENTTRHRASSAKAGRKWRPKAEKALRDQIAPLKARPCMDCGGSFPDCAMQFDHRDPTSKVAAIATMIHNLKPLAAILEEIGKCDLVCANCHSIRTHTRRTSK